jgi:hypothetical protein
MGSDTTIKKPGSARLSSPHAFLWRLFLRSGDDWSFLLP